MHWLILIFRFVRTENYFILSKFICHDWFARICLSVTWFKFLQQTAGSPEPPFLSNAVNKAMRYTQQAALHKDAGTSKHRRLPYTQQMSSCHGEALKNSGHSALHWTRDYDVCDGPGPSRSQTSHSSITPVIEQVTTEDTEDIFDGESQHPLPNETDRKRSFGNPLPVDSKDGATGHIQAQRSPSRFYDGTGFLTPPSDLASSPSICETPPSSRWTQFLLKKTINCQ